ncbi:hypothetical protein EUTSA_v10003202mg [Eutrema salsugineum]|uniref:F-box domain-containing protein n=1 Tax=Eutrema salsugineum TaxID=72664 RepID=V4NEX3_EUTSA|nr:hypothetical protein EUTSA_v10003202mg [Eutrema salsugineum]
MDSRRNRVRLSSLPDTVLVRIISNLPFKLAVKTSVLAKRWKNLHRETTNVAFVESDFVKKRSVSYDEETRNKARVSFVRFMVNWVSKFSGEGVQNFKIILSKTVGFEAEITSLIQFAVSKQVKNLVLDFSDPYLSPRKQAEAASGASVFHFPECVYNLESLKLVACGFDPSRLAHPGSLKSLCFDWIQLGNITALLSRSPLLESLTIKNCWNVGLEAITEYNSRLRELVFQNSGFATKNSTLDLPNIKFFKYTGEVHYFQFLKVSKIMEEAILDFGAETEHDEAAGTALCGLLYGLSSVKKLTVCPFLIKMIKDSEDPVQLRAPMETRHLVIKTNLVPDEFIGITLMINSCPVLETLTFQMLSPIPEPTTNPGFDPETYWTYVLSHECLKKTLKVVEVRNFTGGTYQLHILRVLIRWGLVLEKVDLYLPWRLPEVYKNMARSIVRNLRDTSEASSDLLWIRWVSFFY